MTSGEEIVRRFAENQAGGVSAASTFLNLPKNLEELATTRKIAFAHRDGSGETKFTLAEMPFNDAWEVSEALRVDGGDAFSLHSLSRPCLDTVWSYLAKYMTFSNDLAITPQQLAGAESTAFRKLLPRHKYELTLRGLMLNFMDQSTVAQLRSLDESISNPSGPTT